MYRKVIHKIIEWNNRLRRKPLILNGARQVGKTWLLKSFAKEFYSDNHVYINFEDETALRNLFMEDYDLGRICGAISIIKGVNVTDTTLIIFDEIQEAERGLTALKYFYEKRPGQPIMAAGSMLGISLHQGDSFPVGKVNIIDVYPMDFQEFLLASGNKPLADAIECLDWSLLSSVRSKVIDLLKRYYFVGGMPEAVNTYVEDTDNGFDAVREVQRNLLSAYELDFSKHAPASEVPRIRLVWTNILAQLAKENKKFIYGALRTGSRAKDFEIAIQWLVDAGLVYKIERVNCGELPLKAYASPDIFKLYLLDVGLLGAMGNLSATTLINGNDIFNTFKGALTEQYVYQSLKETDNIGIYYWSAENSSGEVDFVCDTGNKVLPIEVKASENLRSKSLAAFRQKYHLMDSIRFSLSDYREQDQMKNVPLYAVYPMMQHILSVYRL